MRPEIEMQFRRQAGWLKDTWVWLLETKILEGDDGKKFKALDVGCGPGFIMDMTSELMVNLTESI